jgi:hypothetical protein
MALVTYTAQNIFAPADENGTPRSASLQQMQVWGTEVEAIVNATATAASVFDTRASLYANLAYAANTMAWVLNDPTAAYNGIYRKSGGSGSGLWTRVADLPYGLIVASNAGLGTPNDIDAVSALPISNSSLVLLNIAETNTSSPVTVKFNGGSPLTVKTSSGQDPLAGGLVAGMVVLGSVSGSTFRLLTDQASAAIVAQAEAFAEQAETAKDQAAAYAAGLNMPAVTVKDVGKTVIVAPGGTGFQVSNFSDYVKGGRRSEGQETAEGKRVETNTVGAQNIYLFVCKMSQYTGARIEVEAFGNVGGVEFGHIYRTFDAFRVASSTSPVVRANTPDVWTPTVFGGGSAPAGFFSLGTGPDGDDQFLVAVALTSSAASTFIVPRARIMGEYVSFGAVDKSQLNKDVNDVRIFPVTGQSNAQGYNSQIFTTLAVLDQGRAQMFNRGLRTNIDLTDASEAITDSAIRALVDARESLPEDGTFSFQTTGTTFMNRYLKTVPSSVGAVTINAAVGAQAYSALKSGTIPFNNLVTAVNKARSIVGGETRAHSIPAIICEHGESNGGDSAATYAAHLLEWQSDYNTALADGHEIPFLGSQYSHASGGGPQEAWLATALAYPSRFILVGARYNFDYTDGVHLNGPSVARYGYYQARALKLWEDGQTQPFMYIESAVKTGNQIIAKVHMPIAGTSLVIDTTEVTNPGGANPYGLRYEDSLGQTIASVGLNGTDEIVINLSGSSAATGKKLYVALNPGSGTGGRTTGPRANFRDNNPDNAYIDSVGSVNLFNWLVHQTIDVTGT